MKVVHQEPIMKRIRRAVYDADCGLRPISYIELTVREANELTREVRRTLWVSNDIHFRYYTKDDAGAVVGIFFGAEIRVEAA